MEARSVALVTSASGIACVCVYWAWKRRAREIIKLLTLRDYEMKARQLIARDRFEWIAEGAGNEFTLRANYDDWASPGLQLMPRGAVDVSRIDLSTSLLGGSCMLQWPVLVAPTSYQKLAHDLGELASARAAADSSTVFVASHAMSYTSEEVAAVIGKNTQGQMWQQLYFLKSREKTLEFVQRMEKAGVKALVPTIDHPVGGIRERGSRANFRFPSNIFWANLKVSPADWKASADQVSPCVTWKDIKWLCDNTSLPVFVKGVMCGADAVFAAESGASGVIVSNHGGRQLDQGPSTVSVLPKVVAALRYAGFGHCDVLVDGGIRRGSDVLKALALGAKAVLIGRPVLWGLASGGELGVAAVLQILRRELEIAMKLSGCVSVSCISEKVLARAH